jgi:hypothetical protein
MAIIVQGTLRFPDNTPIVGASIKFVASKFIQSGVPIGASLIITTNSSGGYNQSILEGSYHIFIKQSGQELYTHLIDAHLADGIGNVAIGDPITLEEIIGTGPGDTPVYEGCSVIPAPTNFTVSGGFTTIILSWSIPAYICHAVTEIWVSTTDEFTNKALLTTTEASVYSHAIGHDATEYYWIRFRNLNGDYGNWYSATSVTGQTSQNPGEVLADLQQDVYNSTLFNALRTNINSSFYQETEPTFKVSGDTLNSGDTWIKTSSSQRYVWDTSQVPAAWVAVTDKETLDALTRLTGTETVADGEVRGFFQATEPLTAESSFGDIWIDVSQPTPLTFSAIKRYEALDKSSSGTLSWRSAPNNALGLSYINAYNTDDELTTLKTDYNAFVGTTLPAQISEIQSQVDNSITTWFKDEAPTLANAPASSWTTNAIKDTHLGDLYYDRVSGYAFRFAHEDIPDSPDAGIIYTWIQISDTDIAAALTAASDAQDTADDKRRVFVGTPNTTITAYDIGDLWTVQDSADHSTYFAGDLLRCIQARVKGVTNTYAATDWEKATRYITTFYGVFADTPAGSTGDMWIVTDQADAVYRYSGTAWVLVKVATLANVNTEIIEQVGYCERTVTSSGATNRTGAYTTKTLCEAAVVTGETFAWRDTGAFAALTDVISSTVDSNTSTIQVQATSINGLESEYSVKLDNNGNVSGFGLSSGAPGCLVNGVLDASITQAACTGTGKEWVTDSSTFLVAADTFAVTGTDETPVIPFVIRTGDANGTCYVNGVVNAASTQALCEDIPGGSWAAPNTSVVGIQGSLVLDGTMSATTIKAGTITGDLIAGTTITADRMDTTSLFALNMQSTNYVANTQGWRIDRTGSIDASNGNFRGSITGATGTFSGSLNVDSGGSSRMEIKDNVIKVFDGGTLRVKLGYLGT